MSKLSKVKVKWSSLPTYFLSRFPLPVDVASKLEKIQTDPPKSLGFQVKSYEQGIERRREFFPLAKHWIRSWLKIIEGSKGAIIMDWLFMCKSHGYSFAHLFLYWVMALSVVIVCYLVCLVFVG